MFFPREVPARRSGVRRPFTPHEDAALVLLTGSDREVDWDTVSRRMDGRSARQCRERWVNYLAPTIRNEPWTDDEDKLLVDKIGELGHCWATIGHFFNGRSENDVKNRWYSHLKFRSVFDPTTQQMTIVPGDASPTFQGRKKRNRVRAFPKQNAIRLLEMQACPFQRPAVQEATRPWDGPAQVAEAPVPERVADSFSPFEFEDEKQVAYSEDRKSVV